MTYADGIACVDASSDDEKPVVAVDTWLTQAEVKTTFECQEVTSNGYTYPRSILCVFVLCHYSGKVLCFVVLPCVLVAAFQVHLDQLVSPWFFPPFVPQGENL